MAWLVKAPAVKADGLSLISGTHMMKDSHDEGERELTSASCPDSYTCTLENACSYIDLHT